jgi:hypothetical protein
MRFSIFQILLSKGVLFLLLPILFISFCSKPSDHKVLATFDGGDVLASEYVEYFLSSTKYKPDVMPDKENLEKVVSLKAFEKMAVLMALEEGIEEDSLYRESIDNNVRKTLFFKYMRQEMIDQVLNDSLIQVYYKNFSPQHQVAYIVRPVKRSALSGFEETQRDSINSAYKALQAGQEFSEVVAKYSQDITTNEKGGSIGYVTRESLGDATLRAVLDTLKQFTYSKPIRGYEAFYIMYRGESRAVPVPPLQEARGKIWQSLYHSRRHDIEAAVNKQFERLSEQYNYHKNSDAIQNLLVQAGFNDSKTITSKLEFDDLTSEDMGMSIAAYDGGEVKLYELFEEKNREPDNKLDFLERFDLISQRHLFSKHAIELDYMSDPEISNKMDDVRISLLRSFLHRREVIEKAEMNPIVVDENNKQDQFQQASARRHYKEELEQRMKERYNFNFETRNFNRAMEAAESAKIEQNKENENKS